MKIINKISKEIKIAICHISPLLLSKILFYQKYKRKLNLENPTIFNEKLMYLKIKKYNKNSDIWKCSDKYLVREYAKKCGVEEENLPPLIKVYNDADEIDFEELPNKFALKCTHGCGFNIICTDKNKIDEKNTTMKLKKWQKTKFGYESAETHYMHIKPLIICEEYLNFNNRLPNDYKIYCFNGIPKVVLVCSERDKNLKLNFFDLEWNELMIGKEKYRNRNKIEKPNQLNKMIEISKKVSKKFEFVRVDFFEYNNKAIMGEMTFTPAACLANYYTEEGEKYLGSLLKITNK
ncbi:MAG: ATP-grasp fold amidoligase family protein [Bacilli bacterium]|nr:ATP-grasp fold amidoligase family protein [Bacilli bacterium]